MTVKDYMEQKKKEMQAELKKHSKDAIVKREKASNEEKEALKLFFLAAASGDRAEHKKANEAIVKEYEEKGIEWRDDAEMKTKAQTVGTSSQGGLLVPVTLRESLIEKMRFISQIRQMATVIPDMPAVLDMPVENALPTTYWVGEGVAITESGITLTKKQLIPYKLAGLDSFTSEALADTAINPSLQTLVEDRYAISLALAENAAFTSGDGSSKPYGFRSSDITPTTVTGNTTAGNLAFGDILRLMQGIPTAYRKVAEFITSSTGQFLLWGMKDSQGRPLYVPDLTGNGPDMFMGRPIRIVDEIPNNLGAGTNETELWFALPKCYWIGNRGAMRTDYGTNGTDFAQDKISLRMIERVAGRPFLDEAWAKMNIK